MPLNEKQINKLFNDVYAGRVTNRKLPKVYYDDYAATLDKEIKKGFGVRKITDKTRNLSSIQEMSENARLFAGGKTYHLTRELMDAKKLSKNRAEYKVMAQKIYDKYERWGEAETNTMLAQAQSCKKWQQIEAEKDLFPKLRYSTIGDACSICKPLDGIVAPVDSSFWNKAAPINHYNCYCILIQETSRARVTNVNRMKTLETHLEGVMDDTFKNNVGKTGEAFPRHPYFEVAKKDEALARRNFDLPIPDIRNLMIEDEQIPIRLSDYEL